MKSICEELFELSRHIKSVDRRTDGQTDRKGDYYRAPAFSMQGPNKTNIYAGIRDPPNALMLTFRTVQILIRLFLHELSDLSLHCFKNSPMNYKLLVVLKELIQFQTV